MATGVHVWAEISGPKTHQDAAHHCACEGSPTSAPGFTPAQQQAGGTRGSCKGLSQGERPGACLPPGTVGTVGP